MLPLYSPTNTTAAYQLNWSLSLFPKSKLPETGIWFDSLKIASEKDGVRILEDVKVNPSLIQFFLSTRPETQPSEVIRSIKGRLQHLIRNELPKAFQRNYHIQSVGDAKSSVLDQYVARQTVKHPMADPNIQNLMHQLQYFDDTVDLSKPEVGNYGLFLNSLQIVLENADGWSDVKATRLSAIREMIIGTSRKKNWKLSRIGLLSNHVHILLGAGVTESPQSIALALMNNIAYVYDMKPVLKFSYYAGTFGSYDRGAIRNRL